MQWYNILGKNKIDFPKRAYGGNWKGQIIWGRLTVSRILQLLKNPFYAGVYTFGRYKNTRVVDQNGQIQTIQKKMPIDQWEVMLKHHHISYISWQDYENNQLILAKNLTKTRGNITPSPAREGCMLLQGLLICGKCGRRVTVRYKGSGGKYPTYECNARKNKGIMTRSCLSIRSDCIDEKIAELVIQVLIPEKINIAIKALQEVEKRNTVMDKSWEIKIQPTQYEAELAEKRYQQVDPANRLVAENLEKKWEQALTQLATVTTQYQEHKQKMGPIMSPERKYELTRLAKNIPKLWKQSKNMKDKKRILRLLIKDITINKDNTINKCTLQIRWMGGLHEKISIIPPAKQYEKIAYRPEMIDKVRKLAQNCTSDLEIAISLNQQNYKSATNKTFTKSMIKWIRHKYQIDLALKQEYEFTPKELMGKLDVSRDVVQYWMKRNYVKYRKLLSNRLLIMVPQNAEKELRERIKYSYKLKSIT